MTEPKHWADNLISNTSDSMKQIVISLVDKIDVLQRQLEDHHHVIKTYRSAGCGCCGYTDETDTESATVPNESNYR